MDFRDFKRIVDEVWKAGADDASPSASESGLELGALTTVDGDHMRDQIADAFASGHLAVWQRCRDLREELIQRHVIDGEELDPYFSVLDHLQNAVRQRASRREPVEGDWEAAVRHAITSVKQWDWGNHPGRLRFHTRPFEVAKAARSLQTAGLTLRRDANLLFLETESELKLLRRLEDLVAAIGGLNVARHIFRQITPLYDAVPERYHLVRRPSQIGDGQPQIPFGYLLLLAAKHFGSSGSLPETEQAWQQLCAWGVAYAALFDVQPYVHTFWGSVDAVGLLPLLRETALFDTLFRIPQGRGSDVVKICRGVLRDFDLARPYGGGWSLIDVFNIAELMLEQARTIRGPLPIDLDAIESAGVAKATVSTVMKEVLAHPAREVNRNFTKPTDAPQANVPKADQLGHNFFTRPLITSDNTTFWLLDRSACTPNVLEAVLAALRPYHRDLDDNLGTAIETFLRAEFAARAIPTATGLYQAAGARGECDIVIQSQDVIIFIEVKKKPLTRRAQAGSDAHLLIDLANSMLHGQVQAGWHEARLRRNGFLELDHKGQKTRIELNGRQVERIAVSLTDFGSFQDRLVLMQFLEAVLHANFSVSDPSLVKPFTKFNALLEELRSQLQMLHPGSVELHRPFFHCWFLSVGQLLVMLDGVTGPDAFKNALWRTRHFATGSSDYYADSAWLRQVTVPEAPA